MFVGRIHDTIITLDENQEQLYRLPPMSSGPVIVRANEAFITTGPKGQIISHTGAASDLELELRHGNHLSIPSRNFILTESLWHDDLWRLRVKRLRTTIDPAIPTVPRQYKLAVQYTSQLPVLERRIQSGFFHDGFEVNWNRQQYIQVHLVSSRIDVSFREDIRQLYNLKPVYAIDISPARFVNDVFMTSQRLDVGGGPPAPGGGQTLFFALHATFPAVTLEVDIPGPNPSVDLPPSEILVRFFLTSLGNSVQYVPTIESNLLDLLDFTVKIPDAGELLREVNVRDLVKQKAEDGLLALQGAPSRFGAFLKPWLVGGTSELVSLGYAPGPNDVLQPNGLVEPATGELVVRTVGRPLPPDSTPVLKDPTLPGGSPQDDGSVRLFDLPDEEPDPSAPTPGSGGTTPVGGGPPLGRPNIGALAKIDHIVILMQENRSFDQVLGFLSRELGRTDVEGLKNLPEDPAVNRQFNRFRNRNFFSRRADPNDPPRPRATAWPTIPRPDGSFVTGPCHDHECVARQMAQMGGFVSDWALRLGVTDPADAFSRSHLRLVMDYFGPEDLPVYALLAREFGVCDHWYTSHVGPTWPNRFVLLTGDLATDPLGNIELDQPDLASITPLETPTLFDHLNDLGVSWKVFEHGYSFLRLFGKYTFDVTSIVPFDDPVRGFEGAARAGVLPAVTLIEPDYIDLPPGNDDHPPADMADGQILINRILRALIESPAWERTLFVITYDEHGGFYDHVQPPNDAAPLGGSLTTLGPRVPGLLISPLVERGKVFFGPNDPSKRRFDHTSIGATILRRFGGTRVPRVSPRMDAARDFREALTLDEPRPRAEFRALLSALPPLPQSKPASRMASPQRSQPIGRQEGKDDFHFLLATVRLVTGEPPKVSGLRRRSPRMTAGELLYYRDTTRTGTTDIGSPAVIGQGGWQNFRHLFAGGDGIIYAVDQQGRLLFYRDRTQDGSGDVANPSVIGQGGWQNLRTVFAGGNGIIYAVDQQGRLLFYRDRARNGSGDVANPSVIGQGGWQQFRFVFAGGDGIIYAVVG